MSWMSHNRPGDASERGVPYERMFRHLLPRAQPDERASQTSIRPRSMRSTSSEPIIRPVEPGMLKDEAPLRAVRKRIEEHLPWVCRSDGALVQMNVIATDYLDHPYRDLPIGTPYAVVAVTTSEAAEAVQDALEHIARLPASAWRVGWRQEPDGLRSIRVFPDFR
jgi:hypothetical protein